MSWSLFKSNILRKTNSSSNNINIDDVANIWANEYDACVKRGNDLLNLETIQTGNLDVMKNLFRVALLKGLATPPGQSFSLPNEFSRGIIAYWAGATMSPFPIPLIPAPGTIQNIVVNSNIVTNVGVWPIYPPIKPAKKQEIMVNMFILAAAVHLFSIGGIIQTTSLYPAAPTPIPAPGVIIWTGYIIPPTTTVPNPNFPSDDNSEPPTISKSDGTDGSLINSSNNIDNVTDNTSTDAPLLNNDIDDVMDNTLPDDVISDEIIQDNLPDIVNQIKIGKNKCD